MHLPSSVHWVNSCFDCDIFCSPKLLRCPLQIRSSVSHSKHSAHSSTTRTVKRDGRASLPQIRPYSPSRDKKTCCSVWAEQSSPTPTCQPDAVPPNVASLVSRHPRGQGCCKSPEASGRTHPACARCRLRVDEPPRVCAADSEISPRVCVVERERQRETEMS